MVPLVQLANSTGIVDSAWLARAGRAYAEGLRVGAVVETVEGMGRSEAIPDHHVDILIAESRKSRTSGVGQRSKPFDRHYLSGEARKDGRLIS